MNVYVASADHEARHAKAAVKIRGRIATYSLLVEQRRYTGGDVSYAQTELERAFADRDAFAAAPPGTAFLYRTETGGDDIWVVGDDGNEDYFGPADGYRP